MYALTSEGLYVNQAYATAVIYLLLLPNQLDFRMDCQEASQSIEEIGVERNKSWKTKDKNSESRFVLWQFSSAEEYKSGY